MPFSAAEGKKKSVTPSGDRMDPVSDDKPRVCNKVTVNTFDSKNAYIACKNSVNRL